MDLGAYVQIEQLEQLLTANHIEIPRIRGLRLMSEEEPLSEEVIKRQLQAELGYVAESLIRACPRWSLNSNTHRYSDYTDKLINYSLLFETKDGHEVFRDIRWDRLHGKLRKKMKLALKHRTRDVYRNRNTFNQYCGQEGVLYIHARIGGKYWIPYGGPDLERQPWFLCKVDDSFDNTYCDIYAKVG